MLLGAISRRKCSRKIDSFISGSGARVVILTPSMWQTVQPTAFGLIDFPRVHRYFAVVLSVLSKTIATGILSCLMAARILLRVGIWPVIAHANAHCAGLLSVGTRIRPEACATSEPRFLGFRTYSGSLRSSTHASISRSQCSSTRRFGRGRPGLSAQT